MTENAALKAIVAVAVAVCTFFVLTIFALQAVALLWVAATVEDLPTIAQVASSLVDEFVESGAMPHSSIVNDRLLAERTIVMTNAINEHSASVVVESLFVLNSQDHSGPIDLYLASPGGWGGNAFLIVDAMKQIDAPVNTRAIGQCYSACALVLAAGTGTRTATSNSIIMVHANLDDSDAPFSYNTAARVRYERLWHDHSKLPEKWFPMTSDRAYYLNAKQALEFKIIDRIVSGKDK